MILLLKNDGFKWHEQMECYLKGYFYDEDLSHEAIIDKLLSINTLGEYIGYLKGLNGEFSMLRETDEILVAAVDFTRSFPLFYYKDADKVVVSDSPDCILRFLKNPTVDEIATRELRISGTTFGNRTLFNEIKTLGSGEILFYDKLKKELSIKEYMEFAPYGGTTGDIDGMVEELNRVYTEAVRKGLHSLGDRTIVVPLTTGWWERILIKKIVELGYKNVVCYSYGGRNNRDVPIARKIAEYSGFPWYFIEYKEFEWFKWFTGTDYKKYRDYATQYVTVPNIQEYLAVKELTEKRMVPPNAVFINVCFTDILRGVRFPKILLENEKVSDLVLNLEILGEMASNTKWHRRDYQLVSDYVSDIFNMMDESDKLSDKTPSWKYRYAYWKERTAKHLANSRRTYEMYGYVWRNIQLEKGIVDFWAKIPDDIRYSQVLQREYDLRFNREMLEMTGLTPTVQEMLSGRGLADSLRRSFPQAYRKLRFFKESKSIVNDYDNHPLLWYNILSRREFTRFRGSITNIIGALAVKYLRDFCNENNYILK